VLTKNGEAIIIDPSFNDSKIEEYLKQSDCKLAGIILTHAHYDHIGNTFSLAREHHVKVYVHQNEQPIVTKYHFAKELGKQANIDLNLIEYFKGDQLKVQDFKFDILLTPGHTPGGVCLKYSNDVFTGDTLFFDSVGRTDLPLGNSEQLMQSLKQILLTYKDDNHIYPGHGTNGLLKDIKLSNQ
jgi:glyoxylase-like metal-dependent hydrolase (beta-lactamase superfamily II)